MLRVSWVLPSRLTIKYITKKGDNMNPLYVDIDVSSKSSVVYLMMPDGSKHSCFPVPNSLDGTKQLSKRIVSTITSNALTDVIIGLEATSVYGDNLVHELATFIMDKGKKRFPVTDSVAKAIQAAVRSSYRFPKTVNGSVNQVFSISINSMRALELQMKVFDNEVSSQMELILNILTSIKGINPVFSVGMIAENHNILISCYQHIIRNTQSKIHDHYKTLSTKMQDYFFMIGSLTVE